MRASGLLRRWELRLGAYSVFCFFFFPLLPIMLLSEIPKTPHGPPGERITWCLETFPSQLPLQDRSPSLTLLSLFCLLSFVLPPLEENGLPFWVPGVLCQDSEIVLWKLLSIQMIF